MDWPADMAPSAEMLTTAGITRASIGAREFSLAAGIGLINVAAAQIRTAKTRIDGISKPRDKTVLLPMAARMAPRAQIGIDRCQSRYDAESPQRSTAPINRHLRAKGCHPFRNASFSAVAALGADLAPAEEIAFTDDAY